MKIITIITLIALFTAASFADSAGILNPGSIAFTSFNSDADSFSFVVLDEIPPGTVIRFTDEEWNGSAFGTGEDDLTWSNATTMAAGTVVAVYDCQSSALVSNNIGHVQGLLRLAQSGETIYAYIGPTERSPDAFCAAVSTEQADLSGTGLIYGQTAVQLPLTPKALDYTGIRSGESSWDDYLPSVNNPDEWRELNGDTDVEEAFTRTKTIMVIKIQ